MVCHWLSSTDLPQQIEQVIANNHEVVLDVDAYKWRYNSATGVTEYDPTATGGGGHCMLVVGYNRPQQYFIMKNSWGGTSYVRLSYDYVNRVSSQWYTGHYITDVEDINMVPQNKAKWIGNWNMDHDGWQGKMVIRRFTNMHVGENDATKIGNYYKDGKKFDVNGSFSDNGQTFTFYIADHEGRIVPGTLHSGQEFDMYNFSWNPRLYAGKTLWSNIPFGGFANRDAFSVVPSNAFNKNEWIGAWNMNHDGWQGILTITSFITGFFGGIFVAGNYRTADGQVLAISGTVNTLHNHIMNINIMFPGNAQPFELYYHTWEDGVFSGFTTWSGHKYGVYAHKR